MHFASAVITTVASATFVVADGWTEQFFDHANCDNPPFINASGSGPVDCTNLAFGSALAVSVAYDYSITAYTGTECTGTGIGDKDDGSEGIYCVNQALTDGQSFQSYSIAAK